MRVTCSGLLLARSQAPDEATHNAIDLFAHDSPVYLTADIGSSMLFFDVFIKQYHHIDCLKLFYNEDMGIVPGSGLTERKIVYILNSWL